MPKIPEIALAKRLYFSQRTDKRSSRPAVRVALAGMVVGVMVMILTICVFVGFKQTVTDKVAGFDAHIQVVNYQINDSYDLEPIEVSDSLLACFRNYDHVISASPFITKPGILKTDSAFHGFVLKGIEYWDFFRSNLTEGQLPQAPQEVLISTGVARQLQLHTGDAVLSYFIDDKDVRARKFIISGIYNTGFAQMDELFVLTPIETTQKLQQLDDDMYSGVDIRVDNLAYLEQVYDDIYFATVNHLDERSFAQYFVQNLYEKNPTVFMWLDLLDMNVIIIIVLMMLVAGFTIVSGLIILILEGVQFIGTMKALGADNGFIRRIFLTQSAMLIARGVVWGNILGLSLAAAQYFGHFIPLDAAAYYVDTVPVVFPWVWLIVLNLLTILLSLMVLLLPSMIISKISPAKVMYFE